MGPPYTIGQLARAARVPTSTVRYYERRGLLRPATRTGSNYRVYRDEELDRLVFIRTAQATGFVLEDIATLLGLRDGATAPCQEVQSLIEERLGDVAARLQDLRQLKRSLESSLELCRRTERDGHCGVIETLSDASRRRPSRRHR